MHEAMLRSVSRFGWWRRRWWNRTKVKGWKCACFVFIVVIVTN